MHSNQTPPAADRSDLPVDGTGEYTPTEAMPPLAPKPARPPLDGTMDLAPEPEPPAAAPPASPSVGGTTAPSVSAAPHARQPLEGTIDLPAGGDGEPAAADNGPPAHGPGTVDYDPYAATSDFPRAGGAAAPNGTLDYDAKAPTADPPFVLGSGRPAKPGADDDFDVEAEQPQRRLPRGPRFELKKVHARGGMGEVWEARDVSIDRKVALKKMRPQLKGKGKEDTFLWEAQVTGQLEHPGIVPVHELGENDEGDPYYVMKFVAGSTMLEELNEFTKLPAGDSKREVARAGLLRNFLSLCQTIAFAHDRGVIHRDIKPENVMVGEYGETLVLDWGLAKIIGADERAEKDGPIRRSYSGESFETIAGSIKGTPWYMAPEVAAGDVKSVDQLSDVFLLGATLYHLITGQKPRDGKTLPELISAAHKPPVPPRQHDPSIPRPLEAICLKAMTIERAGRYPTAKALAEDLERFMAGEPVTAYQESFTERAWRWVNKHRMAISRTAAAVLILAAAGIGWTQYEDYRKRQEAKVAAAEAEAKKSREEKERVEAENRDFQERNDAKAKLAQFRKLAEETRFLVASTNPVAEQAPFFDPKAGLAKGEEALAVAAPWGDDLAAFKLDEDRPALVKDVADLLLLLAQVRSLTPGAEAGQGVLVLLDRAARLQPPTRSYHRLRAAALAAVGRADEAGPESAKADDPKTPLTAADHFLLGEQARVPATRPEELHDRTGKFKPNPAALEAAVNEYRLALRADPSHFWSHFQLGRCLLSLGKAEEGTQALSACVALRPDVPWGFSARGVALTTLRRFDDAAADLNRAISLEPDSRLLRMNRGVLFWRKGDTKSALADFDAVLADPPEQVLPEAAFYKAQLYGEHTSLDKNLDNALASVNRALEGRKPVRTAYLFRAQVHFLRNRMAEGVDDLNSFFVAGDAKFDAKSAAAAGQRGRQLWLIARALPPTRDEQRNELLNLAYADLQDAVKRGGGTSEVFDYLGRVSEDMGRLTDAIMAYTRALEKSPKDVRNLVLRGWATALKRNPQLDAAQADFEAALKIAPEDAEAHTGLGYVLACLKEEEPAQREAQRAVLYGPGDYLILHNVACVFAKLSDANDDRQTALETVALDYLRRAVDLWKRDRSGPNELSLIQGEVAFTKSLRARPEFKKLFDETKP